MMDDLKKVHQDTTTMEKINSITSNVTTTLRADAPMFSKHYNANEELNKSREINIVTPDYNHLRSDKYKRHQFEEVSEQELKPTPCMWDPTDLKYFRDSTNQDMQIEFQSPIGSRSVRSLHSVTEMSGYPTPLQIPSHSYEPKYYLNSDDPRTTHLTPVASPSQHQRPPKQQHYQSQPPHQRGAVSSPIIGDYRGGTAQLNDSSHTPIRRGTPRDSYGSDIVGPPRTHPHSYAHALNDTVATYSGGGSIAQHHQSAESADGHIWQVHFKRAHRNFLLSHSLSPRAVKPGDFVKVEADRGEDMGVVVSKVPGRDFNEFVPTAGYRGRGFSSGQGEKKFILRLATPEERAALIDKVRDEEKALEVIREKVMERRLPMTVLDAEYQFDRHKLIFFFEADRRIDFRELVSDLFSLYKTRIWMQQVDTSVLPDHELRTEIARVAGFLPSSYDPRELYNYTDPDVLSNPPTMLQAPLLNTSRSYGSPSSYASPTTLLSPSRLPSGSASSRYGSDAMPLLPQHNQHQQSFGLDPGGTNLRFGPSQVATCRAVGGPTAAGAGTMFNFMGEQTESQVQPALSFTQFPLFTSETYADPFTAVHSVINYPSGPVTGEGTGLVSNSFYSCFESSNAQTGSDFTEPLRSSLGDFSAPRPSVSKLSDTSSSPGTGGGEAEAALKEESTEQPDSNNLFGIDKWSALKH